MERGEAATKLYEKVADRVATLIARGTLRPGERVPSVRTLSELENVSVSTVLHAYVILENRGLIETRPQSGHYVRAAPRSLPDEPKMLRPTAAATRVSVSDLVRRVYSAVGDPTIVPLGAAFPEAALLPVQKLNRTLAAVTRGAGTTAMSYDPPPGLPALRREIARRSLTWGCALSPDDFVVTCGAMEALYLSLSAVARAGDTIAIESPAYYGVLQAIEHLGLRAVEIPTHPRHGVELDALESIVRRTKIKACLLVPNFNNPLGSCLADDRKEELVRLLEKHDVPLIEDDICGDLHFGPTRPKVCKAFERKGAVLLCGSFSKTLAPGYRVGWVAPGRYREKVELLKFAHTAGTASPCEMAIAAYLSEGGFDRHLRTLRTTFASHVERMSEAIGVAFPPGTRVTRPAGGFVLWVELPRRANALELHARALRAGIGIAPGPIFSPKQRFQNFIRINCGRVWNDSIERAVGTLGRLAAQMAA